MPISQGSPCFRFGVFEIDVDSGELRRQGVKIKLHDQPFKVLTLLAENPGQVITRQQLCERLWPADTFTESDLGLNAAIMKLRAALGDSAENPRFIETIPRRGYRLIVPVQEINRSQTASSQESSAAPAALPDPETNRPSFPDDSKPKPKTRPWLKAVIALAFAGAVIGGYFWYSRPKVSSYIIAVLPLKNLSADPDSDYFADGLTDEIINNLSVIDGLEVKSQTSSFAFKDKPRDIHTVGAQLRANLVLEGSVLRADNKLRVNVQLVRVSDDRPLWSGHFEREPKDVFAVQDEISRSIVNELRLKLGRGQRRYSTNLEAYDVYLKALALQNQTPGWDSHKIAASLPLFEETIVKDPTFAPAYAGIANAYAYLSATPRTLSAEVAYPKMSDACEKALQLDPLLAEAHACMGLIHSRNFLWDKAEKEFRESFQLNPNLSRPHQDFAIWVLLPLGRMQEGEKEFQRAVELDPLSARVIDSFGYFRLGAHTFEEVIQDARNVLKSDPDNSGALQNYARALVQTGRVAEGIAIFEKHSFGNESFLGYAYAKAGRFSDAEKILDEHKDWPWLQATVSAGLGDKDRVFEAFEQMNAIKDPRLASYPRLPEFDLLRGDTRLTEFRRAHSLPATP
jgi:TolB-like protein/DNA-binding winged helix-turn-helix (wHTH) protein/Tfp pilus assembly protein PilF